ncbi:MAG: dihydrofolate reductase [Xanthobacteraceae bacterium]
MTTPFKIVLVAAVGENGVIGYKGQLPWRLKSDLRHFRHVTINRPLVMGRKTYDSIGKPLDHRTNNVLSRDLSQPAPGTVRATTLEAALGFARDDARKRHTNEIMVIGGGDLFEMLMPRAARLEITHVHASPPGDVFFPPIDPKVWKEVSRKEFPAGPDDSAPFAVAVYERK